MTYREKLQLYGKKGEYEITKPHVSRELDFYSRYDFCSSQIPILFARRFEDTHFDWKNRSSASKNAHLARSKNISPMHEDNYFVHRPRIRVRLFDRSRENYLNTPLIGWNALIAQFIIYLHFHIWYVNYFKWKKYCICIVKYRYI